MTEEELEQEFLKNIEEYIRVREEHRRLGFLDESEIEDYGNGWLI